MQKVTGDRWLSRQQHAGRQGWPAKTPVERATKGAGPSQAKFDGPLCCRLCNVIHSKETKFAAHRCPLALHYLVEFTSSITHNMRCSSNVFGTTGALTAHMSRHSTIRSVAHWRSLS